MKNKDDTEMTREELDRYIQDKIEMGDELVKLSMAISETGRYMKEMFDDPRYRTLFPETKDALWKAFKAMNIAISKANKEAWSKWSIR